MMYFDYVFVPFVLISCFKCVGSGIELPVFVPYILLDTDYG